MTGKPAPYPVKLENVWFNARTKPLIKDISATFADEEGLTVILGPNGAGKSLLLRLCHGILPAHEGLVTWGGGDDPGLHDHRQAMVFQRPVHLRRTAGGNIDFALKLHKMPRLQRAQRIDEALELTGLSRYRAIPARLLSFGEQQRLALARAWALAPDLLLLDEPTANLDPAAQRLIEEVLLKMIAGGTRVLMSSHDLNQARRLASHVVFLYRGRIKEQSSAEQFFAGPKNDLAQSFLRGDLLWWRRRAVFAPDPDKEDDKF
ncbi:MAG: ATP-binding cassette domain-containing protein [Alphaproteobacteria bacterium]|nr:ATP-binding cassette domain-containing protein [Alphaproteobacteria bacterium]MBT5161018.1 ATP-binding cassette domain-containing protein [Alphaproteobacteria bacterium]